MNKGRALEYCFGWTKNKIHILKTLTLPNSGFHSNAVIRHRNLEHYTLPLLVSPSLLGRVVKIRNYIAATSLYKNMCNELILDQPGLLDLKQGLECGHDPQRALSYASKALKYLDRDDTKPNLALATCLQLLGSVWCRLQRYEDSLGYLNRANEVLWRCKEEGCCTADDIRLISCAVHFEVITTKKEEGIRNLRKALEMKEAMDCSTLGDAYRHVAEEYLGALNFEEAKHYCLKALEMHSKDPLEMARDRRLLGVIESGYELDRNAPIPEKWEFETWGGQLLHGDICRSTTSIIKNNSSGFGTCDLRKIVNGTKKDDEDMIYAMVFVSMARELLLEDELKHEFGESKRWLAMATDILNKNQVSRPLVVGEACTEMSVAYEAMNELETAISLLKKARRMAVKFLERSEWIVLGLDARIGWLLLLSGNFQNAVAILEKTTQRMKHSFKAEKHRLAYAYNNLGVAYMELHMPQLAAQAFTYAKDFLNVSVGPHHRDSIQSCRNLSKAYAAMGNYEEAIKFEGEAVEVLEWKYEQFCKMHDENRVTVPAKFRFAQYYFGLRLREEEEEDSDYMEQLRREEEEASQDPDQHRYVLHDYECEVKILKEKEEEIKEGKQRLEQLKRKAPSSIDALITALPLYSGYSRSPYNRTFSTLQMWESRILGK